jgi:hypothetical protein
MRHIVTLISNVGVVLPLRARVPLSVVIRVDTAEGECGTVGRSTPNMIYLLYINAFGGYADVSPYTNLE